MRKTAIKKDSLARPTLSSHQEKLKARLSGAKFRWLNEQLYTQTGREAFCQFQKDPQLFQDYHEGFQEQVKQWPENPLDVIIRDIEQSMLSEEGQGSFVISDMGCGEGRLALYFKERFPQRAVVHSFDLIATNAMVVACDMLRVPLAPNSMDVVVYCLSLMSTDWMKSLEEGLRILRPGGIMYIAEIASRFEAGFKSFLKMLRQSLGLHIVAQNVSNSHFVLFILKKATRAHQQQSKNEAAARHKTLKPCLYKRR